MICFLNEDVFCETNESICYCITFNYLLPYVIEASIRLFVYIKSFNRIRFLQCVFDIFNQYQMGIFKSYGIVCICIAQVEKSMAFGNKKFEGNYVV